MTLFYLTIDSANQNIQWVRAGHDPGIFYDPAADTFEDLKGKGIALGVDQDWQYEMNARIGLVKGQIILLSTDGVWEAHNRTGEIFGKARLYEIIRQNSAKKAKEIIEAVLVALGRFQKNSAIEDDVTLVVIKIEQDLAKYGRG
jgi:sigma-B regulation protein RsbU (phosphoserine phosphatase)